MIFMCNKNGKSPATIPELEICPDANVSCTDVLKQCQCLSARLRAMLNDGSMMGRFRFINLYNGPKVPSEYI